MNKTIAQTLSDESNVSRVAYQLWEDAGRPVGRDLEFWLAAEAKVRAATAQPAAPVVEEVTPAAPQQKGGKAARPSTRGTAKKTWPKPYPSLPKF
jgi:hypothetical protein